MLLNMKWLFSLITVQIQHDSPK